MSMTLEAKASIASEIRDLIHKRFGKEVMPPIALAIVFGNEHKDFVSIRDNKLDGLTEDRLKAILGKLKARRGDG